MVGMNVVGLSAVGDTLSHYNDTEISRANMLTAHALDFSLESDDWSPAESEFDLFYGNTGFRDITIKDEATSTDFSYIVRADNITDDTDYCDDLHIKAEYDSTTYYEGSLSSFLSTAPEEDTLGTWHYTLNSPVNHQNKICSFDIVYNGWQKEMPGYMFGGYHDTEKVENTISSWGLRINKVYYDVAPSLGSEPENEWVEIFNQTNVPLDISEWELCDNTSCDTMPTSTPLIPADGYAVISATSTTWDYWNIPDEVVKIEIDGNAIGGGLANDGDHLLLKRPDGVVIDAVGWGDDTTVWNSAADDVAEGGMLARNPSGHDTDSPDDWSELLPPTVDMIYPDENDNSQTWYWNHEYTIRWNALNHNGPDEDLSIDLSYIRDINANKNIDDGDTEHTIATGIGNIGEYEWTVPSGFIGSIWIKLVAYGPENPMVHAFTFSGRVWDPSPSDTAAESPLMSTEPEAEPMPEMKIVGKNPAMIALGAVYSDMGARVYNIDGDDMTVHTFVGGEEVEAVSIDTSTPGEQMITYEARSDGYVLTGTRRVVIYEGEEVPDASLYEVPEIRIVAESKEKEVPEVEEEVEQEDDTTDNGSAHNADEDGADTEDNNNTVGAADNATSSPMVINKETDTATSSDDEIATTTPDDMLGGVVIATTTPDDTGTPDTEVGTTTPHTDMGTTTDDNNGATSTISEALSDTTQSTTTSDGDSGPAVETSTPPEPTNNQPDVIGEGEEESATKDEDNGGIIITQDNTGTDTRPSDNSDSEEQSDNKDDNEEDVSLDSDASVEEPNLSDNSEESA